MRRWFSGIVLASMLAFWLVGVAGAAGSAASNRVYVLHVDESQEIDPSMAQITERVFSAAEADPRAVAVALVINTPGGLVTSALDMKQRILKSKLHTVALVTDKALSAGALIATAAEKLYMEPGSVIGAAEPRLQGTTQPADYKTLSAVAGEFASTAQARGRNPAIAVAMVDKRTPIPGQQGELLTMSFEDAIAKRYADGQAGGLDQALELAGIKDYEKVETTLSTSDHLGRILTRPWVATLLLVVGVIAIGLEFIKPGVTLPGLIGILSLGLFFLGNVLAGTAGWVEIVLALLGVLLLIIEAFIPGFGVFGLGGIGAIAASIFLAVPTTQLAVRYLTWMSVAFVVALFFMVRAISERGLGKALTLSRDERGFVPARADLSGYVGREGKALTTLRPAGTAQFGDDRADVVTEGEFVTAGTPVKVMRVDGARITVRSIG